MAERVGLWDVVEDMERRDQALREERILQLEYAPQIGWAAADKIKLGEKRSFREQQDERVRKQLKAAGVDFKSATATTRAGGRPGKVRKVKGGAAAGMSPSYEYSAPNAPRRVPEAVVQKVATPKPMAGVKAKGNLQCYACKMWGHTQYSPECPKRVAVGHSTKATGEQSTM
jgi:hypothetical protein